MTNDGLSPDEINGLLGQMKSGGNNKMSTDLLSKVEKEALIELLNVSFGSSSPALSTLFSEQVSMMTPKLLLKQKDELLTDVQSPSFVVLGQYEEGIDGLQFLLMDLKDVQEITKMVEQDNEIEDDEKQFQAVQEFAQKMFTSVSQSMTAVLDQKISYSLVGMDIIENQQDFNIGKFTEEELFVQAAFQLKVGSQLNLTFYLSIPVSTIKQMVGILTDPIDEENSEEMQFQSMNQSNDSYKSKKSGSAPKIQPVQFSSFDESNASHSEPNNLNMLLDIPLQVTVELGRTKRMVKEILEMSPGSIIELDKLAGEPVDILVNNKLIAKGEVVVIDENFGVRVTDILSTMDRISKLR